MTKRGIYKLKFGLHSWAFGPVNSEGKPRYEFEIAREPWADLSCFIPFREGDFEPNALSEIDDIVNLSPGGHIICCSDKFYSLLQEIDVQPYKHQMINVFNRKKKLLGEYHLVLVSLDDRIPVIDAEHSDVEALPASDGKPVIVTLEYSENVYIYPENLPDHDLFLSEAECWMATDRLLQLCRQNHIKGLHFNWLGGFKN